MFLNEDGSIMSKKDSGMCSKRQRQISRLIKTARTMGLMPYTNKWHFDKPFCPVTSVPRQYFDGDSSQAINMSREYYGDTDSALRNEEITPEMMFTDTRVDGFADTLDGDITEDIQGGFEGVTDDNMNDSEHWVKENTEWDEPAVNTFDPSTDAAKDHLEDISLDDDSDES